METRNKKRLTAVFIRGREALDLLSRRATAENRSGANAAETTIIESLSSRYGINNTKKLRDSQEKNPAGNAQDVL